MGEKVLNNSKKIDELNSQTFAKSRSLSSKGLASPTDRTQNKPNKSVALKISAMILGLFFVSGCLSFVVSCELLLAFYI